MNRNVEQECGKVQVKGKEGLKGMSVAQIEKIIEDSVKSNANLMSDFMRIKKGKVAKGESKRLIYCKFMKDRIRPEWNRVTGSKAPSPPKAASPPKAPSPPKAASPPKNRILAQFNAENFPFVLETEETAEPSGENENAPVENIYNTEFEQPQYVPYVRNRRKEKDPFSGKPSRTMMARIDAKIRRAKAAGQPVPNFKNMRSKIMWAQTFKPGEVPPPVKKPAIKRKKPEKKPRPIMVPVKRMKFNGANARIPTRSKIVLAAGTKLSRAEIKKATDLAERITNRLARINLSNTNALRTILLNKYAAGNVNGIVKKLQNLENKNYSKIRNVMRTIEFERARVLKNLGAPIAPESPKRVAQPAFSMIGGGPKIENLARSGRAKKVANQTPEERRAIRVMNAFARMKAKSRASEPAVKMFVTQRAPNVNSNSNTNENMGAVEVRSVGSSAGSNTSSAGRSPKAASPKAASPKKVMNKAEAKKIFEKAKASSSKRPVSRNVRMVKQGEINLSSLNKNRLVNIAKQVYAVVKPGETIPFEKANKNQIKRLINLAAKKL